MKFIFYLLTLICLSVTVAQEVEEEIAKTEKHLTEILTAVSARLEENLKSSLPEFEERLKSYMPHAETILKQYYKNNNDYHRIPIIPTLPEKIALPDLRLIKFDFVIVRGNISFWDQSLEGLNTLTNDLAGAETPEGEYNLNFRIDIGKISFNGLYDIDIVANLSTGGEGSIDDPIGLVGNGKSFLNISNIFLDLNVTFGKQANSELVTVGVALGLGSGDVNVGFENMTLFYGETPIFTLPDGLLDPIVTPILNDVLGLVGPLLGGVLQPLVQGVFQSCELQEVIDFFEGRDNLACFWSPIPDPTSTEPAPTTTTTTTTTRRPPPSSAPSNFQNSLLLSFLFVISCLAIRLH